jgi:hypothetical protein
MRQSDHRSIHRLSEVYFEMTAFNSAEGRDVGCVRKAYRTCERHTWNLLAKARYFIK